MEGTLEKVGKISELTFEMRLVRLKKKKKAVIQQWGIRVLQAEEIVPKRWDWSALACLTKGWNVTKAGIVDKGRVIKDEIRKIDGVQICLIDLQLPHWPTSSASSLENGNNERQSELNLQREYFWSVYIKGKALLGSQWGSQITIYTWLHGLTKTFQVGRCSYMKDHSTCDSSRWWK